PEQFCGRNIACENKDSQVFSLLCLNSEALPCVFLSEGHILQHVLSPGFCNFRFKGYGNIRMGQELLYCRAGAVKFFSSYHHSDLSGISGKEKSFLYRCKSAAHYKNIFPCKELAVTGSAV